MPRSYITPDTTVKMTYSGYARYMTARNNRAFIPTESVSNFSMSRLSALHFSRVIVGWIGRKIVRAVPQKSREKWCRARPRYIISFLRVTRSLHLRNIIIAPREVHAYILYSGRCNFFHACKARCFHLLTHFSFSSSPFLLFLVTLKYNDATAEYRKTTSSKIKLASKRTSRMQVCIREQPGDFPLRLIRFCY